MKTLVLLLVTFSLLGCSPASHSQPQPQPQQQPKQQQQDPFVTGLVQGLQEQQALQQQRDQQAFNARQEQLNQQAFNARLSNLERASQQQTQPQRQQQQQQLPRAIDWRCHYCGANVGHSSTDDLGTRPGERITCTSCRMAGKR